MLFVIYFYFVQRSDIFLPEVIYTPFFLIPWCKFKNAHLFSSVWWLPHFIGIDHLSGVWVHTTGLNTPLFNASGYVIGPGPNLTRDLQDFVHEAHRRNILVTLTLWNCASVQPSKYWTHKIGTNMLNQWIKVRAAVIVAHILCSRFPFLFQKDDCNFKIASRIHLYYVQLSSYFCSFYPHRRRMNVFLTWTVRNLLVNISLPFVEWHNESIGLTS